MKNNSNMKNDKIIGWERVDKWSRPFAFYADFEEARAAQIPGTYLRQINLSDLYRVQRRRSKGWRMPPNTVYVGRPGKYGNPFRVDQQIPLELVPILDEIDTYDRFISKIYDAAEAVRLYEKYFPFAGTPYELTADDLAEISGKNLACWCKMGEPCHADHLLKISNPLEPKMGERPYSDGNWMFEGA